VNLRVKTAKRLWPATVDPTQVDDALVNLAINARDAMPDGGTLTIETQNVSLDDDYSAGHVEVTPGDYVMLAVSDYRQRHGTRRDCSGVRAVLHHQAGRSWHRAGAQPGVRLGQAVPRSYQIYSELDHGTTVKLYLPRAELRTVEREAGPEPATPKGDEMILVVEDNPNVRKTVIRQLLRPRGTSPPRSEGGAQALQLVRDGLAFDLLLTDVVMPGGITGLPACRPAAHRPARTQSAVHVGLYRARRGQRPVDARRFFAKQALSQAGPGPRDPRCPR